MLVNISTVEGVRQVELNSFIEIRGVKCFVHKEDWEDGYGVTWKVSEYRSGWFFGCAGTKKEAISRARKRVRTRGVQKFLDAIEKAIEKTGVVNQDGRTI